MIELTQIATIPSNNEVFAEAGQILLNRTQEEIRAGVLAKLRVVHQHQRIAAMSARIRATMALDSAFRNGDEQQAVYASEQSKLAAERTAVADALFDHIVTVAG